jgi:hypothetical protein
MALALRTDRLELNPALGSIGELKNVILHSVLEAKGFTNLVNSTEVAGDKPGGIRVSVLHLPIAGREFWRVIACIADASFETARATMDEVGDAIDHLAFL